MLVWNAMPSMTLMMSAIFLELAWIAPMLPITWRMMSPPLLATSDAEMASLLAWLEFSALCLTVEVSSSIDAAVSSSELACNSVLDDRSRLPWAISTDGGRDGVRAQANLPHDAGQAVAHVSHGGQKAGLVARLDGNAANQVALGNLSRDTDGVFGFAAKLVQQVAGDPRRCAAAHDDGDDADHEHQRLGDGECFFCIAGVVFGLLGGLIDEGVQRLHPGVLGSATAYPA